MDRFDKIVLQFRDVLAETERLAPDELQSYQQKLLEPLLQHARQHVPFYAQRLAPLFRAATPDLSRFDEIPILRFRTKADIAALWAEAVCPLLTQSGHYAPSRILARVDTMPRSEPRGRQ